MRIEKRNLKIALHPKTKEVLEKLAKLSGMTLNEYCDTVLTRACMDWVRFRKGIPILVPNDAIKKLEPAKTK